MPEESESLDRRHLDRQPLVFKNRFGAVVDVAFAHAGALHHGVEGTKFFRMKVTRSSEIGPRELIDRIPIPTRGAVAPDMLRV